jgi:acyl-ACP thioesterase
VLSRIYYELYEPLPGGCRVSVKTWHRGASGALFYRDFEISSGGRAVGFAVSAWAVLDLSTRRLLRPAQLRELYPAQGQDSGSLLLSRLKAPENMDAAGFHTVSYSDLDLNGHANNTRYADFVCNALGMERLRTGYIRKMQINYLSECLPGDLIGMRLGFLNREFYITGTKQDGQTCYEASVQMETKEDFHG